MVETLVARLTGVPAPVGAAAELALATWQEKPRAEAVRAALDVRTEEAVPPASAAAPARAHVVRAGQSHCQTLVQDSGA
ncbi:hypothetical protein [Streptomyces sioyaensis]|uniref:hypothetical protein n=1 Tax=Streptomyces sioyaensis TaxID=67364 RepID=UPI003797AD90